MSSSPFVLAPVELKPLITTLATFLMGRSTMDVIVYGTLPGGNIIIQVKMSDGKIARNFVYNTAVVTLKGEIYTTNVKLPTTRFPEMHLRIRRRGKVLNDGLRKTHEQWPASLMAAVLRDLEPTGLYHNMCPNIVFVGDTSSTPVKTEDTKEERDMKEFLETIRALVVLGTKE